MSSQNLFDTAPLQQPLAARMRPRTLKEYMGQTHLLGKGKPLRLALERGQIHSMILWGPPGVGKTSLARLLANEIQGHFIAISAVLSGVKEIRAAVAEAEQQRNMYGRTTVLFVDEVHRFNKSQQDAFLPYVEDGTVVFVGATTENPSFEVNNALLSRCRVYVLKGFTPQDLTELLQSALADTERGLGARELNVAEDGANLLIQAADGDARRLLNLLEIASDLVEDGECIDLDILTQVVTGDFRRFDKGGDIFYEQISALHKSVRGSDPDAALYWFARMLDGGCDPLYIARRVVRMASEDIGNADPRGLAIATSAWDVFTRLGSPEGELAIAHAIVYLAAAPKSNAVYNAFNAVMADVKSSPSHPVPNHLRNAPTGMMKDLGFGEGYRYAHSEEGGFAAGENYFPDELEPREYYQPVERGLEIKIAEKLRNLRSLNEQARHDKSD
ncbi:replication-associated recombination protein A [Saccharophagus degradans]|uniref:Replication-associated recombination protein A n=1 Tax=Saccharophagus degradans TaxID=86304 RepID=A0AAW7XAH8_9GAMM|nr:replication-associated recombination protein A [Saccharophagus degradans]MDO6424235.1 replication-associated recombination protein A [Saccharophagus degradans]MDO6608282.1 replication-associated recombination protein A [Saccharophagus degradans]